MGAMVWHKFPFERQKMFVIPNGYHAKIDMQDGGLFQKQIVQHRQKFEWWPFFVEAKFLFITRPSNTLKLLWEGFVSTVGLSFM
jgi:hypothetical protein